MGIAHAVLGVAFALIGALASAGVVHLTQQSGPEAPAVGLTIPYLFDAGGVSYKYTQDEWALNTLEPVLNPDHLPTHYESKYAFRVRNGTVITDEIGRQLSTVSIELGSVGGDGLWRALYSSYYNASDLRLVRADKHVAVYDLYGGQLSDSDFPQDHGFGWEGNLMGPDTFVVAMQGRTLPYDMELVELENLPHPAYSFDSTSGTATSSRQTFAVGHPLAVGGQMLTPVTSVHIASWVTPSGSRGHDEFNATYWFDGVTSFPVHSIWQARVYSDDAQPPVLQGQAVHDSVRIGGGAGQAPIKWGTFDPKGGPPLQARPNLEATLTGGDGWVAYPVDLARKAIESDPSLLRFTAWRLQNPNSLLVGASYDHDPADGAPSDPSVERWTLVYGSPGAATLYAVESVKRAGTPAVQSDANSAGLLSFPAEARFAAGDVPDRLMTLGQAVRLWSTYESNATKGPPTSLVWGFGVYAHQDPTTVAWNGVPAATQLRRMSIVLQDVPPTTNPTSTTLSRSILLDVADGRLLYGQTFNSHPTPDRWLATLNPAPPRAGSADPALPSWTNRNAPVAAAATAFSLILVLWFLPRLRWVAIGLFSRVAPDRLLDNRLRDELVRRIEEDPGISPPALHKLSKAGWTTVVYHLQVLERAGKLASVRDGRHRRYFVAGKFSAADMACLACLKHPSTAKVNDLIRVSPGIDRASLAERMEMSRPSLNWHVDRLKRLGLVVQRNMAGRATYLPGSKP